MFRDDYSANQLSFAYCYHVYFRWSTHRLTQQPLLTRLDQPTCNELLERFGLHILVCETSPTEVRILGSFRPEDSVAVAASKLKGQTSRWLREVLGLTQPIDLFGKGYFACTSGKSEREQVEGYLTAQSEHHGYADRILPPVHVEEFAVTAADEERLQARHAHTVLQFHLVLSTWRRRGLFGPEEASHVTASWRNLQTEQRFALRKVSFLPDHVHLAVHLYPATSPAAVVLALMNAAQQLIWEHFPQAAIQAKVERLWQPSAYIGNYGDLETLKLRRYLDNWIAAQKGEG